jgi:hypothetical protein
MDAVERFVAEAVAFREWAVRGIDAGEVAARNALIRITRLYLAARELPPAWSEELADPPDAERVDDTEWRAVFAAAGRLPLDSYGELFDPSVVPPEEPPVVGSLSDDIADFYRDVVSGRWAFEAGQGRWPCGSGGSTFATTGASTPRGLSGRSTPGWRPTPSTSSPQTPNQALPQMEGPD